MTAAAQIRVPHLRDGFIVDKVGIERSETAPAYFDSVTTSEQRWTK